ncbi:MAG: glutamate 5-kinase [Verrucomicrobia bacterium]|nr:glutamate 5-kinase [Verrucomicrobiota bacterium]
MDRLKALNQPQRVVVKIGTGLLTNAKRQLDLGRVAALTDQIAALRSNSIEVVVVSSGAIGAGMGELGMTARPTALPELQACAAIGQCKLMSLYAEAFRQHGLYVAQILLTHTDLSDRIRHLNVRNTIDALLSRGVVPIINENDTVAVDEIRFGDNDRLAALTAALLPADLLVILTTAQGLMTQPDGTGERIPFVARVDENIMKLAGGAASAQSVGGMVSKLQSAKIVHAAGIPLVIANGRAPGVLADVLAGKDIGTLFAASQTKMAGRKRWIAFYHRPSGWLGVDAGAKQALIARGCSLLARGIIEVGGEFAADKVVSLRDQEGSEFARGVARFSAADVRKICAAKGCDVATALGRKAKPEVVHRDDLVLL